MPIYTCELCKKEFKQKVDYDRHKSKKTPCVSVEQIKKIVQTEQKSFDETSKLQILFRRCLDILRDCEHLTGDKALRTLAHLLILRLLEPQIGKEIDIDGYNYEFNKIKDEDKEKMLSFTRFSTIAKQKEVNIPVIMKLVWNEVLSQHPKTKYIFEKGRGFDINEQLTYCKLVKEIMSFDFDSISADVQGHAYEEVIKDVMTGKVLGQFFTPTNVKKMMVELIDPQLHGDGTMETIFDPAMGTGGFLITSLRHIMKQSEKEDIKIDWKFISKKGLGGREAEPDTYQLARANMLISTGHMFDALEKGDSIRDPIKKKYDIVLANPPFGIKGLTYENIICEDKDKYLPIKSNSAVPLFLQAIIRILNVGGRCAVVIPCGQELFGKKDSLIIMRKFLMKTCNLKEVIELPSGVFTYTGTKTCVLYFIKKREGDDVVDVITKTNKDQKEINRTYKFVNKASTKRVKFYDYNPYTGVKNLLIKVPIDDIVEKDYSLKYSEYLGDDDKSEKELPDDVEEKTLDEVCEFERGKQLSKEKFIDGQYPVIGGGQKPCGYHDEYNMKENTILCSSSGAYAGFISKYSTKVWASDCFSICSSDDKLTNEYLYYYLKNIQDEIYKLQCGAAQPHIYPKSLVKLTINIPSLDRQKEIVEQLDFLSECIKTNDLKIGQLDNLMKINVKLHTNDCETVKVSDVCTVKQGKYITKETCTTGIYPVYGGGDASYYIDENNRENDIVISKDGVSQNCVRYVDGKFFLNHHGWTLDCNENIIKKYMYYYLFANQDRIYNLAVGTAQKGINQKNFYELDIKLPSFDIQKKIIQLCDSNKQLIESLEKETECNKEMMKKIIST